jgi:hypothetical protein
MPPAALIGVMAGGMLASTVGSGLSQSAANAGVRPVNPGLYGSATSGLGNVSGPGFSQLLSLMKTGNPVDTSGMEQGLQSVKTQTDKSNLAILKEQFGSSGLSASSPAAVGTSNYLANSDANFLQTIANLRYQSATDATNREVAATQFGLSSLLGPAFQMQGPKGSVAGAVLGSGGGDLQTLALLQMLGFGSGSGGGGNV